MLLDSHSIDLVMRALADSKRSRVLSAPRILVNDNTTGILSSVAEVPYTSVNASQTVATTAFAGFAKAGTTISVTPHISEGDHLQLEFKVTLNSFTGSGNNGVPPPRQTNEVESKVIVPDGHTIIVGGLNQKTNSTTTSGVPYLQDIPILGHFFGMQSRSNDCSSLFVFIRPLVLREDKFNDLKFLSSRDGHQAGVGDGLPSSQPVLLR
jgi:type IV pilus assembly protein PilQ